MPAIASTSASASSSRMSSPAPTPSGSGGSGPTQPIDAYRPISGHVKKPIIPLLPSSATPNLPTLLSLDPITHTSRLSGKTLQASDPTSSSSTTLPNIGSSSISPLVRGKKRNRGYPSELQKVRDEQQRKEGERRELGLSGMRKVRRRLGGVMSKGTKISYNSLIPLNHLHTNYLFQLLSLPPLPSPSSSKINTTNDVTPTINSEVVLSKLSKADFTGMKITVISSKNPSLVNQKGIIIEETCSTFRIVTEIDNKVKVIPKNGSLFRIHVPAYSPLHGMSSDTQNMDIDMGDQHGSGLDLEEFLNKCPRLQIDLLGSNFLNRSGDRAGKKVKPLQGNGGGSGWAQDWIKETDWEKTFNLLEDELDETNNRKATPAKGKKRGGGGEGKKRKRNKSRRKDPPAFGNPE
ncbi:hypothetical protein I203_105724 [Kwoniella mangroviensis CBS 8507]|uniref:uncharacterized protein n=1 Tax=Kwoniella mangroviensis CBS 8507 TaxID=1296122 RepID=UPI00080CEE0F|nr:uncharacterized protein I203_01536 [Kwoniella mangroviensis CBS 8507]OCF69672.1 hypothetical protein I203_01536 [Kwoniella mangroviensis CBS 8507]